VRQLFQETADEGQGGADLDNGAVMVTLTTASNNTSSLQQSQQPQPHQQPPPIVHSPPSTTNNSNPLTVKDLMLGVIEMQLKRNPNSPADNGGSSAPNSSGTPTISSILKTDHRNDITYVRGYKSSSNIANAALSNRDSNLATLSVVSGPHHGHRSAPSPQQIGKFINNKFRHSNKKHLCLMSKVYFRYEIAFKMDFRTDIYNLLSCFVCLYLFLYYL